MKITDLTVTIFPWENIPLKSYDEAVKMATTKSDLGLVLIKTDEGLEGHGMLGLSVHPATLEAQHIVRFLKPILMGEAVARPSTITGQKYRAVSESYFTAVHEALAQHTTVAQALASLEQQLVRLTGLKTGPPAPAKAP